LFNRGSENRARAALPGGAAHVCSCACHRTVKPLVRCGTVLSAAAQQRGSPNRG